MEHGYKQTVHFLVHERDLEEWLWKNADVEKGKERYQYGVRFVQVLEEDYWKSRKLISGGFK